MGHHEAQQGDQFLGGLCVYRHAGVLISVHSRCRIVADRIAHLALHQAIFPSITTSIVSVRQPPPKLLDPAVFVPLHFLAFNGKLARPLRIKSSVPADTPSSERLPRTHVSSDNSHAVLSQFETRHVRVARSDAVYTRLHALQHVFYRHIKFGARPIHQFGHCLLYNIVPLWRIQWVSLLPAETSPHDTRY